MAPPHCPPPLSSLLSVSGYVYGHCHIWQHLSLRLCHCVPGNSCQTWETSLSFILRFFYGELISFHHLCHVNLHCPKFPTAPLVATSIGGCFLLHNERLHITQTWDRVDLLLASNCSFLFIPPSTLLRKSWDIYFYIFKVYNVMTWYTIVPLDSQFCVPQFVTQGLKILNWKFYK